MSSNTNVETNIVQMKFDNAQFEKNCKETMSTLDKLKEKLHSTKSANGLSDLGAAAKDLGLSQVEKSLDSVNKKMSILGVAGATVVSELTKKAMEFAHTVTTAVPNIIKQGGWTRAMNIEQAKFQLEGLGIAWSQVGEQISNAVSGTAYSMDSAAKAASQLAASGVEISGVGDQMERSLKAISGVAAQTNSSYDDIANIFTTIAGNGRLMGDQLRQLSSRGMNAAAALGKALDKTEEEVRDMVSKGQISFETFSEIMFETFGENAFKANETFSGSLDNMKAALKRTGEAFAGPIQRQMVPVFNSLRQAINRANTEVFKFSTNNVAEQSKYTDAIKNFKEELEDLETAYYRGEIPLEEYSAKQKELKYNIEAAEQALDDCLGPFEKFAKILQEKVVAVIDKVDFSFLDEALKGFINLAKSAYSVLKPLGQAFLDVFGITQKGINQSLQDFANKFAKFTEKLILSNEEMDYLKRAFRGIISVLSIARTLFMQVLSAILGINVKTGDLRKNILKFLGTIGDIIYVFSEWIKESHIVETVLKAISTAIYGLIGLLAIAVTKIIDIVNYIRKSQAFQTVLNTIKNTIMVIVASIVLLVQKIKYIFDELRRGNVSVLGPLGTAITFIKDGVLLVIGALSKAVDYIKNLSILTPIIDKVTDAFNKLKDVVYSIFGKKDNGVVQIKDEEVPLAKLGDSAEEAGNAAETAGKQFGFFSDTLEYFREEVSLSRVATALFVGTLLAITYKVANALEGFGKGIKSIGAFSTKLSKNGLVGLILGTGERTPNKMLDTAIAIGVLAASLLAISKIPADRLTEAANAVSGLMAGYAGMMIIMTYLDNMTGTLGGLTNITKAMMQMTIAISGLAIAFSIFANMEGNFLQGVIGMVGAAATLVSSVVLIAKFAPTFAVASGSLIGLSVSIGILTSVFKKLVAIPLDDVKSVIKTLLVFSGFVAVIVSIGSFVGKFADGSSFVKLSAALLMISVAFSVMVEAFQKLNIQRVSNLFDKWSKFLKNDYIRLIGAIVIAVGATVAAIAIVRALPKLIRLIADSIKGALDKASTATTTIKRTVDYMGMALNKIGIAAIILSLTAAMIALAGLFLIISKVANSISDEELKRAAYIMIGLTAVVASLMFVAKMTSEAKPTAILASILAIGVILGSIYTIGLMLRADWQGVAAGFVGVLIIMRIWSTMMYFMSKIDYKPSTYKGLVAAIAGIGVAVYGIKMLADSFKNDEGATIEAVHTMMLLISAFAAVMVVLGKSGYTFAKSKLAAMLITVSAFVAIGAALSGIVYFADETDSILAAMAAMMGVMYIFGQMAKELTIVTKNPAVWGVFASIAGMAVAIGGTLIIMVANLNGRYADLAASAVAIVGVAIIFGGIAYVLSQLESVKKGLAVMLASIPTAIGIAVALAILANYDWQHIQDALAGLAGAAVILSLFAAIMTGIAMTGFGDIAAILGGVLAVSFAVLAAAASLLVDVLTRFLPVFQEFINSIFYGLIDNRDKLAETGAALLPFAAGLAAVGGAGVVLLLGITGLTLGAVAITAMSGALYLLQKIDFTTLSTGLKDIAVPLLAFGAVAVVLGSLYPALIAAAAGLAALGLAVVATLNAINKDTVDQLQKIPGKMYEIGLWIPISLIRGMKAGEPTLLTYAAQMATAVESVIRNILQIHSNSPLFNDIGSYIPSSLGVGIEQSMPGLETLVGGEMSDLVKQFDISDDTAQSGKDAGDEFIANAVSEVNSGFPLLDMAIYKIKQKFKEASDWVQHVQGIADEVNKKKKEDTRTPDEKNAGRYGGVSGPSLLTQKQTEARKKSKSSIDELSKSLEGLGSSGSKAAGGTSKAAEAVTDLSSAFSYASKSSKVHLGDMINNLKSNIKAHVEWTNDLKKLVGKGYDDAVIDWVESMGEGGHETVKALMKGTEAEVDTLNKNLKTWLAMDEGTEDALLKQYGEAGSDMAMAYVTAFGDVYDTELADRIQSAVDPFGEFNRNVELTAGQMLKNMKSQLDGIGTWNENMKKLLEKGVSEDIYNYFLEQGVSSYEEVAAMVNMTDDQIKQANEMFAQQLEIGREVAKQQAAKYQEVGMAITQGLADGVDLESVKQTGEKIGTTTLEATKTVLGVHSPSTEYFAIGKNDDLGLRLGTLKNAHLVYTAAQEVAKHTLEVTYKILNEEAGEEIGMFLMRGLERGIRTGKSGVINTIADMAKSVIETAYEKFEINSPSHVFQRIGFGLPEGLGLGVNRGTEQAVNAIDNMSGSVIDRMSSVVEAISQNLDSEFEDISPVITPRLNLEELQNGRDLINRIFGSGPAAVLTEDIEQPSTQNRSFNYDAVLKTNSNSPDVVTAITELRSDLATMTDAIAQMQVVLDGQTLVGEIAAPIDEALGQRAIRAGRRN